MRAFEDWRARELSVWFDGQAQSDRARLDQMDAALAGAQPAPVTDPDALFFAAASALLPTNPDVARAFSRMMEMLITPTDFAADPTVRDAVSKHLAAGGGPPPMTGPTREAFVALAGA